MRLNETGKVLFTAQGYDIQDNNLRRSPCCFAGDYDRLVVGASSHDHGIYFWSSASNGEGEQSVDRPVRVLREGASGSRPKCPLQCAKLRIGLLWRRRNRQIMVN